jgi:hypothetical protein
MTAVDILVKRHNAEVKVFVCMLSEDAVAKHD